MGCLLRELRKESGMTQEQMAEQFGVSNRTVSRWENGKNMPDISVLIEMSNYFNVGVLELIEGERAKQIMTTEKKDELKEIANYADGQKRIILKNIHRTDIIGLVGVIISGTAFDAFVIYKNSIWLVLMVVSLGICGGMLGYNIMYASGVNDVLKGYVKKYRFILFLERLLVVILICSMCKDLYLLYYLDIF